MPEVALETGHVGLNVTDLARSKQFYRDVFQFDIMDESTEPSREYAFLGADGKLFLTLWKQSREAFQKHVSGLHHLSFKVPSIEEVKQIEGRVRKLKTRIYHDGIVPHGEGRSSGGIYFEDPDGIRLEVFAPSGAEKSVAPTPGAPTCGFF